MMTEFRSCVGLWAVISVLCVGCAMQSAEGADRTSPGTPGPACRAAGSAKAADLVYRGLAVFVDDGLDFADIKAQTGVDTIFLTPYWTTNGTSDANVVNNGDGPPATIRKLVRQVRAAGLKVWLKPHVLPDGGYQGDLDPPDRTRFFATYTRLMLEFARLLKEEGADGLVVGTELNSLDSKPADVVRWRKLVAAIRAAAPGLKLTYSATVGEMGSPDKSAGITWWDALDYIGVNTYPASGEPPGYQAFVHAWEHPPPKDLPGYMVDALGPRASYWQALGRLSAQYGGKKVILTEVGIPLGGDPDRPEDYTLSGTVDEAMQATWIRAFLDTAATKSFVAGFNIWNANVPPYAILNHPASGVVRETAGRCWGNPSP
jgi:hypothetical protein